MGHPQFYGFLKLLVQKLLLTSFFSIIPLPVGVSLSCWQESSVSGIQKSFVPSSGTYKGLTEFSPLLLSVEAQKILLSYLRFFVLVGCQSVWL